MRPSALALPSLLVVSVASVAGAQPSVDLRGLRPSTDPASGIYVEPASSPDTGEWSAGLWMSYAYRPIVLRDSASDEVRFAVLRHQLTTDFTAGVGIARRAVFGLALPVLLYQTGDGPTPESTHALGEMVLPGQALGDLGLIGKLTLVQSTGGEFGGFALALHERFTLPTGDEASLLGEGSVTGETRILVEYRLLAFGAHLATGVKLRGDEAPFACRPSQADTAGGDACATRFGHEIPFGLGLSIRPQIFGVDPQGRSTLFVEAHGYVPVSPVAPFESQEVAAVQLGMGARYALREVSFLAGVETAAIAGIGNAPLRVILSAAWFPRDHDADSDGVDDEADQCRELAEDRDGFQDDDGCPEGDNDEDGVFDDEDRCPAAKEDEDGYQDEDGCPDPDNDLDKIPDAGDACPDEPGAPSALREKNGCPDRDSDADGVLDGADACPDQKGSDREDPTKRGCPDADPVPDEGEVD